MSAAKRQPAQQLAPDGEFIARVALSKNSSGASAPAGTGIAHVVAGTFVSPAAPVGLASVDVSGVLPVANGGTGLNALGAALQVLRVNALGTALEYATPSSSVTLAGDVTGPSGSNIVVAATGAGGTLPLATTAANIVWAAGTTAPALRQAQRTGAGVGETLTIQSQAAQGGGGALGGPIRLTNGKSDSLVDTGSAGVLFGFETNATTHATTDYLVARFDLASVATQLTTANNLFMSAANGLVTEQAGGLAPHFIRQTATPTVLEELNGVQHMHVVPLSGRSASSRPLQFGQVSQAQGDVADRVEVAAVYQFPCITYTGDITLPRAVTLPTVAGGIWFVFNATTSAGAPSGLALTFHTAAGANTVVVASATGAWVRCDGIDIIRMTANSAITP